MMAGPAFTVSARTHGPSYEAAIRFPHSTPQRIELKSKDDNIGLQRCARPEQPRHCIPDQP